MNVTPIKWMAQDSERCTDRSTMFVFSSRSDRRKRNITLRFEGQICSRHTRKMLHTHKGSTFCRNVWTTCMQIQECPWALNYRKQSLDTTQRSKTNENSVTGASYCDSQSNNSTDCSSPSMPLRPLPDDLDCKYHSAESSSFHSLS